ncbi:MAG: hypothetical protein K6U09_06130 [Acidobacteriia bacterium]|jgi:hypothetical protein|nr:hypothetical protein [Terriglobia bacterium]
MPQSYLIFDFGADEQAAQQARHRIEAWRQAFRLGEKMRWKFERSSAAQDGPQQIRLLVRLDFSEHERLSHQRWLERLPTEAPFRTAKLEIVRTGDTAWESAAARFDALP